MGGKEVGESPKEWESERTPSITFVNMRTRTTF